MQRWQCIIYNVAFKSIVWWSLIIKISMFLFLLTAMAKLYKLMHFLSQIRTFHIFNQIKVSGVPSKSNIVEDEIPERGLWNPQISSIGSWTREDLAPSTLLHSLFICMYLYLETINVLLKWWQYLNGGLFEITLTIPLNDIRQVLLNNKYLN